MHRRIILTSVALLAVMAPLAFGNAATASTNDEGTGGGSDSHCKRAAGTQLPAVAR